MEKKAADLAAEVEAQTKAFEEAAAKRAATEAEGFSRVRCACRGVCCSCTGGCSCFPALMVLCRDKDYKY